MTELRRSHCSYNFQLYLGFNAFASVLNLWPQTQRGTIWTTVCGSTSQKRVYYIHGKSGRFITVIPNDNYLLCDSWVIRSHCHSAAGKLKLNWFGTVQPGNTHWMEEATWVEKPSCSSGKNAQDEKKSCMHTQNTHKHREARKKRVRWKLD